MYTCKHCGDPATINQKIQQNHFPFATIEVRSYCWECYMEIHDGKMPMVTGPSYKSKKGSNIVDRRNL